MIDWLIADWQIAHLSIYVTHVQERRVRLFDRGEVNTYKDELSFLLTLASNCRHTAVSLPASLQLSDLDRYQSTYRSLLSLLTSVTSWSADQSQSSDDLIAVVRRYVAARWLRRVLIDNNVTTDDDDIKCVECCMLDASKRWFWLRQFVNALWVWLTY